MTKGKRENRLGFLNRVRKWVLFSSSCAPFLWCSSISFLSFTEKYKKDYTASLFIRMLWRLSIVFKLKNLTYGKHTLEQKFLSRFVMDIPASSLCESKENEQKELTVCCSFSTMQILLVLKCLLFILLWSEVWLFSFCCQIDSRPDGTWDSREKTVAFSFDYCYWSVDPEDPKYASQEMVSDAVLCICISTLFCPFLFISTERDCEAR